MSNEAHYFIGISIPEDVRAYLTTWSEDAKKSLPFKTWVGKDDYHITLAFLGSVPKQKKKLLEEQLIHTASSMQRFHLEVSSLQWFGNAESPRVLWLGVEDSTPLKELQAAVSENCQSAHLPLEKRPYRPHITIAKRWNGSEAFSCERYKEEIIVPKQAGSFYVNEFSLFQIHLNRLPRYEPVHKFELQ